MFTRLFKKIDGLMQNLTLITIYLIFAYFMAQVLRYILII
nr:hypothetical protein [uncultured Mediterranean phage uvMED]